jgi:predicted PurR-regulated permease PerM
VTVEKRESAARPRPVLRLSPFSLVRAVVLLGLTLSGLALIAASARVIGWVLVAATLAGLLHPAVEGLARRLPRALALAVVVLVSLGIAAGVGYAVVDDLNRQLHELQSAVPKAARDIERSDRFGKAAQEIHLEQRAKAFVDELPSDSAAATCRTRSAARRRAAWRSSPPGS